MEHQEARDKWLARSMDPSWYKLVVGSDDVNLSDHDRRVKFEEAISQAWFLNSNVVEGGENTYFLGYKDFRDFKSIRDGRTPPGIDAHGTTHPAELRGRDLDALYEKVLETLQTRPVNEPLSRFVTQSGTTERYAATEDGRAFECELSRDFFRRHSFSPVCVRALSALAYARFWSLARPEGGVRSIPFRYRSNVLTPQLPTSTDRGRMQPLFDFLNKHVSVAAMDERGPFEAEAGVIVNVDLDDRFLRLRIARERVETEAYLTVRANYRVKRGSSDAVSSKGLLRAFTGLLVSKGFRIERATNMIFDAVEEEEAGYFEVIAQALVGRRAELPPARFELDAKLWTSGRSERSQGREPYGLELCRWIASESEEVRLEVRQTWAEQLQARLPADQRWQDLWITMESGYAPIGR